MKSFSWPHISNLFDITRFPWFINAALRTYFWSNKQNWHAFFRESCIINLYTIVAAFPIFDEWTRFVCTTAFICSHKTDTQVSRKQWFPEKESLVNYPKQWKKDINLSLVHLLKFRGNGFKWFRNDCRVLANLQFRFRYCLAQAAAEKINLSYHVFWRTWSVVGKNVRGIFSASSNFSSLQHESSCLFRPCQFRTAG